MDPGSAGFQETEYFYHSHLERNEALLVISAVLDVLIMWPPVVDDAKVEVLSGILTDDI